MSVISIQPWTFFLFQWFSLGLFSLVGDGYHSAIFRSTETECDFFTKLFARFIIGIGLFIIMQLLMSWLGFFSLISILYLLVGIALALHRLYSAYTLRQRHGLGLHEKLKNMLDDPVNGLFWIALVLITVIVSVALSGYVGSTNHDAATHTFFTRVMLEQQRVPITTEPFNSYVISYPLGVHSIMALFVILGTPIYAVAILTSSLLPLSSALGAYSSINGLLESRTAGMIAGIITALASRAVVPTIGWGGLPFGLAIVFLFPMLSSVFAVIVEGKFTRSSLLFTAIIIGLTPWLHPAAAFFTIIWCSVCVILKGTHLLLIRKRRFSGDSITSFTKRVISLGVLSIILVTPFLLRMFIILSVPNQGYPADVLSVEDTGLSESSIGTLATLDFNYLFNLVQLSLFGTHFGTVFWLASLTPLICVAMYYPKRTAQFQMNKHSHHDELPLSPVAYLYSTLIIHLFVLKSVVPNLPLGNLITVAIQAIITRIFMLTNILLIPLVAFVLLASVNSMKLAAIHLDMYRKAASRRKRHVVSRMLVMAMCGLIIGTAAFNVVTDMDVYYSRVAFYQETFNIVTSADVELMIWMVDNLPDSSIVLVGYNDAGEYVSAVTGLKTVYEYAERIRSSLNYNTLLTILTDNPTNATAKALMDSFGITHVFIGANIGEWVGGQQGVVLNATHLLGAPWFSQLQNQGDAYLLEYTP